ATSGVEPTAPKERLQLFSPETSRRALPHCGLSRSHKTLPIRSAPESHPPGAPRTPAAAFGPGCWAAQPHPEAQAGPGRAIRPRIGANSFLGTVTSASWKVMYLAWATTLTPNLISFPRSVVSVQPRIAFGRTSCRKKLARL